MNYKFGPATSVSDGRPSSLIRSDGLSLPFSRGNTECQRFLLDWKTGATVTNADGSPAPYSDEAVIALGLEPPL